MVVVKQIKQDWRHDPMLLSCLWLFGLFTATLLANGLATTDIPDFFAISRDITKMSALPGRELFYSSPLNFIIANLFHLVSLTGFFVIHVGEVMVMLVCVAAAVSRKLPNREQRWLYLVLLSLTPLWLVVMKWLGKTDPVLIGGFFLCWGFASRWRMLVVVIMIMAHRELGSLMTLALFVLESRDGKNTDKNLLYALAVGNGLQLLYQYGLLDQLPSSRAELMSGRARSFWDAFIQMPALYIMSMFSWYWIFICLERPRKIEFGIFALAFVLALMNEDFTRDFTLAALPAMVFHIERAVMSDRYGAMKNLWPLTLMHFQIAALGHFFAANNSFIYLLLRP